MDIQWLRKDDNAVSPVIGVILMVAITVILAAVISTFVLGLGEQVSQTSPQATFGFEFDDSNNELTITHNGGATLEPSQTYVNGTEWTNVGSGSSVSEISAGDSVTTSITSSGTVSVTWQSDTGETSATLAEWKGADA